MTAGPASRIQAWYRIHAGENAKPRPAFYSKTVALLSFVRAAERVGASTTFLVDGDVPAELRAIVTAAGEMVRVDAGSARRSYREMVARAARHAPRDGLVWFAEDDYLYRPDALCRLREAADALPDADYFTMAGSESLDRRSGAHSPRPHPEPGAAGDPDAAVVGDVAWFHAFATMSTFAVRAPALRDDARLLRLCPYAGGAWDTTTSLVLQGLPPFRAHEITDDLRPRVPRAWARGTARAIARTAISSRAARRPGRRRLLLASDPELVHHMESPAVPARTPPSARSRHTDWPAIARVAEQWAGDVGRSRPVGGAS